MKWIILFSLLVFTLACSNEPSEMYLSNASLKCEINGADLRSGLKSVYYKRGDAPVYISGVILTAKNTEYNVSDVVSEYTFNPYGESYADKDIVLEGLTVGNNIITAKGVCNSVSGNNYYMDVTRAWGDLTERANQYAETLKSSQPIYADYKEETPLNIAISNRSDNRASISMVTENHRVAVVLENSYDSKYNLALEIKESGSSVPLFSSTYFIPVNTQDAFVINNDDARGNKTYTVTVTYYDKYSYAAVGSVVKTIVAGACDNITKLYYFNKGELEVGDVEAFMTWVPWVTDNKGETIN